MAQVTLSTMDVVVTVVDELQSSRDAERAALRLLKAGAEVLRRARQGDDKPASPLTALKSGTITLIDTVNPADEARAPIGFTMPDE